MPRRKLSDVDRAELLSLHAGGSSLNDLAAAFDISPQHAGRIVRAAKSGAALGFGDSPDPSPLTLEEAERYLARAVRKGSVGALRLWFDRYGGASSGDDDPLAAFLPGSHDGRG